MELITVKVPKGDGNKWHADLFLNKVLFRHGVKIDIFYAYKCAKCNLTVRLEDL